MICVEDQKNEFGQFMRFEYLTYAPIDLEGVDKEMMTERDIALLNAYHRDVYKKLSPYLEGEEKEWLKEATRELV